MFVKKIIGFTRIYERHTLKIAVWRYYLCTVLYTTIILWAVAINWHLNNRDWWLWLNGGKGFRIIHHKTRITSAIEIKFKNNRGITVTYNTINSEISTNFGRRKDKVRYNIHRRRRRRTATGVTTTTIARWLMMSSSTHAVRTHGFAFASAAVNHFHEHTL